MFKLTFLSTGLLALSLTASLGCEKKPSTAATTGNEQTSDPSAKSAAPMLSVSARQVGATVAPLRDRLLSVGDDAPKIEAVAHNGQNVKLADFRGKVVVVYFYPKDDTPGCTIEAKGIRDGWADFKSTDTIVLGVSTDDNDSHRAFAKKYELPFLLLPDPKQEIANAFKVPVLRGYAKRVTFVINKQGKVAKVFPEVTPSAHAKELLATIEELKG